MSLVKYEFQKLRSNKLIIVSLIALCLFVVATLNVKFKKDVLNRLSISQEMTLANKYKGQLTDEKIITILNDYGNDLANKGRWTEFQSSFVDKFVDTYNYDIYTVAQSSHSPFSVDSHYFKSMQDVGFQSDDFKIELGNFVTWSELFRVMEVVFLPIALMIILFCSTLFANERVTGMLPLLFSTEDGRTKMVKTKLAVGSIGSLVGFFIIQTVIFACYLLLFGTVGWDTSIQANLMMGLSNFSENWNQVQVYVCIVLVQFVELLFVATVTLFVSSLCRTTFSSLAISLILFFMPMALLKVLNGTVIASFLSFLPINFFRPKIMLSYLNTNLFIGSFSIVTVTIGLIAFYVVTSVIMNCVNSVRMKRVQLIS